MPRVPTYDAPQVAERALPGVRQSSVASPALFSAGADRLVSAGQSALRAGSALSAAADEAQRRDDLERVQAADATYKERLLEWKMQATERYAGVNADALLGDFQKWHEDQVKDLDTGFTNDAQRATFGQVGRKNYGLARSDFGRFVLGEKSKTQAAALDATISNETNLAAVAASDDEVGARKNNIAANIRAFAAAKGWDEATTTQRVGVALTNLHMQRLQGLVDRDYEGAKAYLDANRGEIDGSARDKAENLLKIGGEKAIMQRAGDEAIERGLSESEALAEARAKYKSDPTARAAAEQGILRRYGVDRQVREAQQKDAADRAWSVFGRTGSLANVPASVIAGMDGRDLATMRKMAEASAAGKAIKTDSNTYYELRTMASQDPEGFAQVDLRRYFDKLDAGDREKFIDLQQGARKGEKPPSTWEQQKSQIHRQRGWTSKDTEKKGSFDRIADQEFLMAKKRLGREPNYQETQQILDRLVMDGEVVSGHWYTNDPDKRFYEVRGTEDEAKFVPKVPDAERKKIEAALQRAGRPINDDEVARLYKQKVGL